MSFDFLRQPSLQAVLHTLDPQQTRIVGGAVRDALMGRPVNDIDLASVLMPEEVTHRAQQAGYKVIPTGIGHGTVTVLAHGTAYEVTTLRSDLATDGRHAAVAFGTGWRVDALRRDFTMNALSMSADGQIYDYVNGRADIDARHVRFIGDAHSRIREDYLRILRFFRFHAACGAGEMDHEGLTACTLFKEGLRNLSRERVRAEMLKLLSADGAPAVVAQMGVRGILNALIDMPCHPQTLARLAQAEAEFGRAADPLVRLAALAVTQAGDAEKLAETLRLSGAEKKRLLALAAHPFTSPAADDATCRRILYENGATLYRDHVLLAAARSGGDWHRIYRLPDHWSAPTFPLRGQDLLAWGLPAGPALGRLLRALEEDWIKADYPVDREAIRALLQRRL
jgi:poly(A) polymerase